MADDSLNFRIILEDDGSGAELPDLSSSGFGKVGAGGSSELGTGAGGSGPSGPGGAGPAGSGASSPISKLAGSVNNFTNVTNNTLVVISNSFSNVINNLNIALNNNFQVFNSLISNFTSVFQLFLNKFGGGGSGKKKKNTPKAKRLHVPKAQMRRIPSTGDLLQRRAQVIPGSMGSGIGGKSGNAFKQFENFGGFETKMGGSPGSSGLGNATGGGSPGSSGLGNAAVDGAGAEGLLAAAGPVAAIILVIQGVSDSLARVFSGINSSVNTLGEQLKSLASNDYLSMFKRAVNSVSESMEKIPLVGKAIAESFKVLPGIITAFAETVQAFVQRGQELSSYNGALASSGARSEVTEIMDDIKEANAIGPDLARLENAQTDFYHELREILLPIKQFVVAILAPMMEFVVNFLRDIELAVIEVREVLKTIMSVVYDLSQWNGSAAVEEIKKLPENIKNAIDAAFEKSKQKEESISLDSIVDSIRGGVKSMQKRDKVEGVPAIRFGGGDF